MDKFKRGFVIITDCLEGGGDMPDFGGEVYTELRTAEDLEFQGETVQLAMEDAVHRALQFGAKPENIYIFPISDDFIQPIAKKEVKWTLQAFK